MISVLDDYISRADKAIDEAFGFDVGGEIINTASNAADHLKSWGDAPNNNLQQNAQQFYASPDGTMVGGARPADYVDDPRFAAPFGPVQQGMTPEQQLDQTARSLLLVESGDDQFGREIGLSRSEMNDIQGRSWSDLVPDNVDFSKLSIPQAKAATHQRTGGGGGYRYSGSPTEGFYNFSGNMTNSPNLLETQMTQKMNNRNKQLLGLGKG